jgi:hypothetical protein
VTIDHRDGAGLAGGERSPVPAWPEQAALADLPAPPLPAGLPAQLANRALVYLRPDKIPAVLPYVDARHSGMILAGDGIAKALRTLQGGGAAFPVLTDPEAYKNHTATREAPFWLPGADSMIPLTLEATLDAQLHAGVTAALTPTGYIPAADTDALKAAIEEFARLGRTDAIFLAPLDISLIGRGYFEQTAAILADFGRPVALVLGCQGNPLDHSRDIIPNLRELAGRVPLMPIRTDFNGFDLLGQGAVCTAIGTGGAVRHTVDPAEKDRSFNPGPAPSVLWPELLTYFKGNTIAEFFGARPKLAPACGCPLCHGRLLTRFLRREHQNEAIAHGVACWSPLAAQLLSEPTVRGRAERWQLLCGDAVAHHQVVLDQLNRLDGLSPQPSLKRWAVLPAWPAVDARTPVA